MSDRQGGLAISRPCVDLTYTGPAPSARHGACETYALMLAGLAAPGMARRRRLMLPRGRPGY